jgi:hypothetical protein
MTLPLIFGVSVFGFILGMIGLLESYYSRKWSRFVLILICVIALASSFSFIAYQWFNPPQQEMTPAARFPQVPL